MGGKGKQINTSILCSISLNLAHLCWNILDCKQSGHPNSVSGGKKDNIYIGLLVKIIESDRLLL